jgi:NADPH-dependent curcumin reductase CurA
MKIKRIIKWSAGIIFLALVIWLFIAYWLSTNDCDRNAATPTIPMKAILNCEYGVENLQLRDIEKPTPADNEILVRVRAASVNPVDGHTIRGSWLMRPMSGLRKPKNIRFGTDFAGTVETVGKNITSFKPGDEVFGAKNGAVSE